MGAEVEAGGEGGVLCTTGGPPPFEKLTDIRGEGHMKAHVRREHHDTTLPPSHHHHHPLAPPDSGL